MKISDQDLEGFRSIYAKEFSETITLPEAREMATRLVNLYLLLLRPLPGEQGQEEKPNTTIDGP